MAKILQFRPLDYPKDFPLKSKPEIPSIAAMVCTLKRYHFDELTEAQRDIILVAEQLAMQGRESAIYLRAVHHIYLKITGRSMWDKIKEFFRRK